MPHPAAGVFHNGRIRTDRSWAEAVAVAAGRIVAVGGWAEIRERIGPDTEVVDLDGRFLGPGFQDAHIHPHTGGQRMVSCDLTECVDADSALQTIAAYAAAHPASPWIHGGGWQFSWFEGGMPAAALLDRVVPHRPAYLRVADGHAGWANSAALAAAGIDAHHPEPRWGRIERLADGSPQGTLQEEGGMALIERLLPEETAAEMDALCSPPSAICSPRDHGLAGRCGGGAAAPGPPAAGRRRAAAGDGAWGVGWEPGGASGSWIVSLPAVARPGAGTRRARSSSCSTGCVRTSTARTLTPYLDAAGC
jgi:hypothetical protein